MNNNLKKNIESIQNDGIGRSKSYNFSSVQVRTMPKGFKRSIPGNNANADNAKKTGFIILIVGFLFLVSLLGAAYYYFVIMGDEKKVAEITTSEIAEKDPIEEEAQKPVTPEKKEATPEEEEELVNSSDSSSGAVEDEAVEDEEVITQEDEQDFYTEEEKLEEKNIISEDPPLPLVDNDNDGLSQEEEMLAGTSDDLSDTDGDTYSDLAEMINGYNPLGEGSLASNPNFIEYKNALYGFSFLHPRNLQISADSNDIIIFDLGNAEFFQIFVEKNDGKLNLEDWYKNLLNIPVVDTDQKSQDNEWNIIRNINDKTIFFKSDKNDYIIAFKYSSAEGVRYASMFEIIFNTFKSGN